MDANTIFATEQVLRSLMQQANAELSDAIEKSHTIIGKTAREEMDEDIKKYRETVIIPIQNEISKLDKEKKSLISDSNFNKDFTWRH